MNWLAFFPGWPMISYCIMLSEIGIGVRRA